PPIASRVAWMPSLETGPAARGPIPDRLLPHGGAVPVYPTPKPARAAALLSLVPGTPEETRSRARQRLTTLCVLSQRWIPLHNAHKCSLRGGTSPAREAP